MPIFDLNNFEYRKVIKLAPDAFVLFNGAVGAKIVSPLKPDSQQNLDPMGGITSISVNGAVSPPGSGRASISIVAPKYKGLHQDYYVTVPSGVRVSYFLPMMEVKIYMKGRFLLRNNPVYYPAFWGFITNVTEDYNDGVFTFTLQCADMLSWWKYQKLILNPSVFSSLAGFPNIEHFPTIFENKNPWQIINQLLKDTQWKSADGKSTYSFGNVNFSNIYTQPNLGNKDLSLIGALAIEVNKYWAGRFSFTGENVPIEMFGLTKPITDNDMNVLDQLQVLGIDAISKKYAEKVSADIALDYNLLARVLPYGDINLFGAGAQATEATKLDIANRVCEMTSMEFYLDLNGTVVFKPPFYNMDVTKADIPYYVVESSDVLNFNASTNSDSICTYLEVTAPNLQRLGTSINMIGFHIDFDLMVRYGMRYQQAHINYGNDANSLRLIAAAEMARINGRATSGSVSIPLRPELRLGYPVYLSHIDAYYYVSGISHTFSYGASSNTTLSLEMRRDRIYDATGEITSSIPVTIGNSVGSSTSNDSNIGRVLRGFVYRFREGPVTTATIFSDNNTTDNQTTKLAANSVDFNNQGYVDIQNAKEAYKRVTQATSGPKFNGLYEISPAQVSKNTFNNITQSSDVMPNASGSKASVMSNELLMITDNTIPYTDINGYRHIGAFPYGANLKLNNGIDLKDDSDIAGQADSIARKVLQDPVSDGNVILDDTSPDYIDTPVFDSTANNTNTATITDDKLKNFLTDPITAGTGTGNINLSIPMGSFSLEAKP